MIEPAGFRDGQCVWVSAGLLSDHVCDRDFDCDHCPLHLALSPMSGRRETHRFNWPKDRLYSETHFWLKQTSDHRARVGLTETAVSLLHPVLRWAVEPARNGGVNVWATLSGGRVRLEPPVLGSRFGANPCLEIDALWPAADAWLSGYLLEFEFADWQIARSGWFELPHIAPHYALHRQLIHQALQAGKGRSEEPVATRAADGGLPAAGLFPVVGRVSYAALLADVLRCELLRP